MQLPQLALSVRQPWAWAIINAPIRGGDGKDIENRDWKPGNPGLKFRGRVAIHASKGMTRQEYEDFVCFYNSIPRAPLRTCRPVPGPEHLPRGGIIGSVEVVDAVAESGSPWFFGPIGLVLADPKPHPFVPAVGALGFFRWKEADPSIVPPPAKWMRSYQPPGSERRPCGSPML